MICCSETEYYFSKNFNDSSVFEKKFDLGEVEYWKCPSCGFVQSRTHLEMDENKWFTINNELHSYIENPDNPKIGNQPPYLAQATFLSILIKNTIISSDILDWGGGYGTFSKIFYKYYNYSINVYEKYMIPASNEDNVHYITNDRLEKKYPTVICSAVFEHVTNRVVLDEINQCVDANGNLIIHTVVCERIPKDSKWFYLLPVHCAFHTNKSMGLLMEQWGYTSSLYCPEAKSWVLFKNNTTELKEKIIEINNELQKEYLYFKQGFMDYWK
jgi:hypothetical protein